MGADIIGWRNCALQKQLGQDGFLGKLKMRAYQRVIEQQVPPEARDKVQVRVKVTGRPDRDLGYAEIRAAADEFARGIPECETCIISRGKPLGCYQYVTYPIDETFEKVVFDFFVSQLGTKDSICDQLYRDVVSKFPPSGTGWHTQRGPNGPLARRAKPLEHTFGGFFSKKRIDSAQILGSLFFTQEAAPLIVGYGRFYTELVKFAQGQLGAQHDSRTLHEITDVANFYLSMTASALSEGGTILVDG
jgi:hypothetical protein